MRAAAPPARSLCQLQPCARCDEAAGNGSGPSAASRHVGVWRGLGQGGLQTGGLQNPPGWRGACGAGMRGTHVLGLGKSLVPASWTGSCPLSGGGGRQGLSGGCLGQGQLPGTTVAEGAAWCSPPIPVVGQGRDPLPGPPGARGLVSRWAGAGGSLWDPAPPRGWGAPSVVSLHRGEGCGAGEVAAPSVWGCPPLSGGCAGRRRGAGSAVGWAGCLRAGSPWASRDSPPALARFPQRGHARARRGAGPHRHCPTVPPTPHGLWHPWGAEPGLGGAGDAPPG